MYTERGFFIFAGCQSSYIWNRSLGWSARFYGPDTNFIQNEIKKEQKKFNIVDWSKHILSARNKVHEEKSGTIDFDNINKRELPREYK